MRLTELIASHGQLRLASQNDNERILKFFERSPMHTSAFDVLYRRQPDFFKLLQFQSDRVFVVINENTKSEVCGVGTISLRPGWINGSPTIVGYLGDLRSSSGKQNSRVWRSFFSAIISRSSEIEEISDCTHWYTAVLDNNREALIALRPRKGQPALIPIGPFTMRNIITRFPMAKRFEASSNWKIYHANTGDTEVLKDFFEEENRHIPLGFRGEMERRLSHWEGLSIENFIYVRDTKGIVACVAPWLPTTAKQTFVSHLPISLRLLGFVAKLFPTIPIRIPAAGEEIRSPYLTHLTFASRLTSDERADVFRVMLDFLFDRRRYSNWHCISVCDFQTWNLGRALKGYFQQTIPITVYAIVSPNSFDSKNGDSVADNPLPPAFEMAMV
jgi:hypothetical protein